MITFAVPFQHSDITHRYIHDLTTPLVASHEGNYNW